MGKRCRVCDGPIANGRCKYCGMPYRNDEVLYHLNESRTDHYRHATPKAQKIMKQQTLPAGDKRQAIGRTSSKEEIREHQQKIRQDAVKRMTETKSGTRPGTKPGTRPQTVGKAVRDGRKEYRTAEAKEKKKRSRFGLLILVLVILFGLVPMLEELFIEHRATMNVNRSEEVFEFSEERNENGNKVYYLGREYGEVGIGELMEKGTYRVSVERGNAVITVYGASGARNKTIADSKSSIVLVLGEKESVLVDPNSEAYRVVFSELSN